MQRGPLHGGIGHEELEKGIYLCEQFTKTKVRMLTDRINSKFKSVRFRLFVEQVNGGLKDDCEVLVPNEAGSMVPFRDANNAARINAGLEIMRSLRSKGSRTSLLNSVATSQTGKANMTRCWV